MCTIMCRAAIEKIHNFFLLGTEPITLFMLLADFVISHYCVAIDNYNSSMASKPINIRWIRTGVHSY